MTMTIHQAARVAREKIGRRVILKQTSGKAKHKACQIWRHDFVSGKFSAAKTMKLISDGDTWEQALAEAGITGAR